MRDPQLLSLGQVEREEQKIPAVLEALTEGATTDAQRVALQEEASRDEDAARRYARFSAMTTSEEDALVESLAGVTKRGQAQQEKGQLISLFGWKAKAMTCLALAAAIGLAWLAVPTAPLPVYRLEASIADLQHRGAPKVRSLPQHHPQSALSIVLRPSQNAQGEVAVDAFWQAGKTGALKPWSAPLSIAPTGAVRVDGRIETLLPGVQGEVTLWLAVRSADRAPLTVEGARALAAGGEPQGHRLLSYSFRILGP